MDNILIDVLLFVGTFVCGVAAGYAIGLREKDEEDKSCISMVDR